MNDFRSKLVALLGQFAKCRRCARFTLHVEHVCTICETAR